MTVHLVVGAGFIGDALARALISRGDTVLLATRSGSIVPGTTSLTVDASDPDALAAAAAGAATDDVMPGTISNGTPAAARASASSPPLALPLS